MKQIHVQCKCIGYLLSDFSFNSHQMISVLNFFSHSLFRYLLVNPRDRRVIICESVLCSTLWRNAIAKVLFKHFEVNMVNPSMKLTENKAVCIYAKKLMYTNYLIL